MTYSQSKFVSPSTLEDVDDEVLAAIYKGMFNLEEMYKMPSSPDLVRLLDQHYFCTEDYVSEDSESEEVAAKPSLKTPVKTKKTSSKKEEEDDDFFAGVSDAKSTDSSKEEKDEDDDDFYDDELRDILNKI